MAKHKFLSKLVSPTVILNIIALVLFGTMLWFGSQRWMNWFTHHGESIEVPELVGMRVMDAQDELYELKLEGVIVDSVYNKFKPAGTVLEQKPEAGTGVKSGRQIFLTVNKSAMDKQPLPNIIGNSTQHQARELLLKNGFILGNTEYTVGDRDMVLGVKAGGMPLRNGQYITPDVPLTLVVGNSVQEYNEDGLIDEEENWEDDSWDNWESDYD